MTEPRRVRAFVAVPRDRMWIESAAGLVQRLKERLPEASWARPESWHITIKLLGHVPPEILQPLAASLAPAARETVPGDLTRGGAIVFPPQGAARVLGAGFAPSPTVESLAAFAHEVDARAEAFGVEREKRGFHAHVTLARLRRPWNEREVESFRAEVGAWPLPDWPLRSGVLYESRLLPEGAVHIPLAEWTFSGGPPGVRA
ncbi:MAG TPA: RNA 2',3'-cyclic phosphodiesterase [Thermoanaerobaculia bacterium]|nr:RNA 2',3'-cyclic phosphodiesterase [Thermoanaerobaculia bacterium]